MANNTSEDMIYMTIPKEYEPIYLKLLVYIVDFGIDLVKDCSAGCNAKNKKVIDCWNMFQSAIAAYNLAEIKDITDSYYKKSAFIINYIKEQINLTYSTEDIDLSGTLEFYIDDNGDLICKSPNGITKFDIDDDGNLIEVS